MSGRTGPVFNTILNGYFSSMRRQRTRIEKMSKARSVVAAGVAALALLLGSGCGVVPGLDQDSPATGSETPGSPDSALGAGSEPYDGELPDQVDYLREKGIIAKNTACEMADIEPIARYLEYEKFDGNVNNSQYDPRQPIMAYGRCLAADVLLGTSQSPFSNKPSETKASVETSVIPDASEQEHMSAWTRELEHAETNLGLTGTTSTQVKQIEGPWKEGKLFYRNESDTTAGSSGKEVFRAKGTLDLLIRDRGFLIRAVVSWGPDYGSVDVQNWGESEERKPQVPHTPKEIADWLSDEWAPQARQGVLNVLQGKEPAGQNR